MLKAIHPKTIAALQQVSPEVLAEIESLKVEEAYLGPFLKRASESRRTPGWIPALATLEWTTHFVESMDFPIREQAGYIRNPSLNLIWTEWNVLETPSEKRHQVIGVYKQNGQVKFVPIQEEWALMLDQLEEGLQPKTTSKSLKELLALGLILGPTSQEPNSPAQSISDSNLR